MDEGLHGVVGVCHWVSAMLSQTLLPVAPPGPQFSHGDGAAGPSVPGEWPLPAMRNNESESWLSTLTSFLQFRDVHVPEMIDFH